MRVRQVQQHRHGQVAAGRVAADDHVGGCPATVGEDVAEGADDLAELRWVGFVWGEGVPREEDGNVVVVFVHDLQEVEPEVEVGGDGGEGEATSCGSTALRLALGRKEWLYRVVLFPGFRSGYTAHMARRLLGSCCRFFFFDMDVPW